MERKISVRFYVSFGLSFLQISPRCTKKSRIYAYLHRLPESMTGLGIILEQAHVPFHGDRVDYKKQVKFTVLLKYIFRLWINFRVISKERDFTIRYRILFIYIYIWGKQWQTTPKNLPRMQCTRAIPVAWLGSGSCPNYPKDWILIIIINIYIFQLIEIIS